MTDDQAFACTLDLEGAQQRLPQVHELTARLRDRQRLDDRLVLRFDPGEDSARLVEGFVRDESRCCSFFGFEVTRGEEAVVLELSAPREAAHLLDAAMASFDPDLTDDDRLTPFRADG